METKPYSLYNYTTKGIFMQQKTIKIYIDGSFYTVDLDNRKVVSGTNHEKYLMFTRSKFMTEMAVTIAEYKEKYGQIT